MCEKDTANFLRSLGVKPSAQRIAIYSYLEEKRNHPTVDTIYQSLVEAHPTLSRTTVYNTLKMFMAHNAVQPILIEDGEMRFDADTSVHGHFKCRSCGEVSDIFFGENLPAPPKGFQADETHLYFRGLCDNPKCR